IVAPLSGWNGRVPERFNELPFCIGGCGEASNRVHRNQRSSAVMRFDRRTIDAETGVIAVDAQIVEECQLAVYFFHLPLIGGEPRIIDGDVHDAAPRIGIKELAIIAPRT